MCDENRETIRRNFQVISAGASDRATEVVTADYVGATAENGPASLETPARPDRRSAHPHDRSSSSRGLGKVGSELLFVNDRVKVWGMRLEPGETCAAHRHRNDYLMLYPDPAVGRSTSRSTVEHVESGFVAFATVGTQGLPPHQITNLGNEPVTHYVIELLGPSATATARPLQHNGRIRIDSQDRQTREGQPRP